MKFATTADLILAVQDGTFNGNVVVDNDSVAAYEGDEKVCDFSDNPPEAVLLEAFQAIGVNAERA